MSSRQVNIHIMKHRDQDHFDIAPLKRKSSLQLLNKIKAPAGLTPTILIPT